MNCKYILDTNIVLDYMLDRINLNVNIYDIFLKLENSVYISSSQIHNIEYIFLEERKRSADLETAKNEWIVFISKVKVIKTPSYINIEDDLFKKDSEAYLIELSAKTIDAKVVTRDKSFLNNSSLAISIDDFLGFFVFIFSFFIFWIMLYIIF